MTPRDDDIEDDLNDHDEEDVVLDEDLDEGENADDAESPDDDSEDEDSEDKDSEDEDSEDDEATDDKSEDDKSGDDEKERAEQFTKMIRTHAAEALDYLVRCLSPKRARKTLNKVVARAHREGKPDGELHPAEWLLSLACEEAANVAIDAKSLKGVTFSLKAALADAGDEKTPEGLVEFLHGALLQLPPHRRSALVLRGIEGRDTTETARLMGTSPEEVRTDLREGMEALRKIIKDYR